MPGITRDSILHLCREMNEFKVSVRPFKVQDMMKAVKENRMIEAFAAGTAVVVSPVC